MCTVDSEGRGVCTVSVRAGSVHCLSEGGECALSQ